MSLLRRIAILGLVSLVPLAAGCSKEVTIGAVISQSGAVAAYGERVKKGMDLALDEINNAGGFKGGSLRLLYKDDATNSAMGRQAVEELIHQDGVDIIIGAVSSPVTLSIAPICQEEEVVLLSPSSSAPEISEAGDYIFRNYPSDVLEGTAMARFARDLGLERVVVFALDNEFGHGLRDVFSEQYTSKYRKVIKTFDFDETQTDKFPEMVDEIKQLDPEGIYIFAYLDNFAELLKLIKEAGIDAVLMGGSSVVPEDLVRLAGDAAENLVFSRAVFDVESRDPVVSSFVAAYRAKYGEAPDHYAAHGYDAVYLILKAMETGGSAHPDDVKVGLLGLNHEGAAGPTEFDENGDVVRFPRMFIIQQGRAMRYDRFVDEGGSLFAES